MTRLFRKAARPLVAASGALILSSGLATAVAAEDHGNESRTATDSAEPTSTLADTKPIPLPELYTETSTTHEVASGEYELSVATEPLNYQTESGSWAPIDPTFAVDGSSGRSHTGAAESDILAEVVGAGFTATLPRDAGISPVRVAADHAPSGAWVAMSLEGMKGTAEVVNDVAVYNDISNADEVVLQATPSGLKETIVLEEPPLAGAQPIAFRYEIKTSRGLEPTLTTENTVEFRQSSGASEDVPTFVIPAPNMFDSFEGGGDSSTDDSYTNNLDFSLASSQNSREWVLTLTPDASWLADAQRVYPVSIDPTLNTTGAQRDCSLFRAEPNAIRCGDNAPHLWAGRTDALSNRARSILYFDALSALPANAEITSSNVQLWLDTSKTTGAIETPWTFQQVSKSFTNGATWNSPDNRPSANSWFGGTPSGPESTPVRLSGAGASSFRYFPVEEIVRSWQAGEASNRGLVLKQRYEETDTRIAFASSSASNNPARRPMLNVRYTLPTTDDNGSDAEPGSGTLVSESAYTPSEIESIDSAAKVTEVVATAPLPLIDGEATEVTMGLVFESTEVPPSDLTQEFQSILTDMYASDSQDEFVSAEPGYEGSETSEDTTEPRPLSSAEIASVAAAAEVNELAVERVQDVPAAHQDDISDNTEPDDDVNFREEDAGCKSPFAPGVVKQAGGPSSLANRRYGTLRFKLGVERKINLFCSRITTFEPDYKSYNYDGSSYFAKRITAWSSTMPSAYKDTQFSDGDDERIYTIGTSRAYKLHANKWYRTYFRTKFGPGDRGRVKVAFQRGERRPFNCHSTWCIFAVATSQSYPRDIWAGIPATWKYTP